MAGAQVGGLFDGLSFFLVQRLPSRSSFAQKIQVNGGRVVKLEAQADHIIADHFRHDCPAGSISYTFVDEAVSRGELPDPADHPAGPQHHAVRDVSSTLPTKATRTPFTPEDDRILWEWVEKSKLRGGLVKGNEIYKQLEANNPRHPFQAWRDRYVKRLMDRPPPNVPSRAVADALPSDPAPLRGETNGALEVREHTETSSPEREAVFSDEEFEQLLQNAEDIENVSEENLEEAWDAWARVVIPTRPAQSWRRFYEETVQPEYRKRLKITTREAEEASKSNGTVHLKEEEEQRDEAVGSPSSLGCQSSSRKRKRGTPEPLLHSSKSQRKATHDENHEAEAQVMNAIAAANAHVAMSDPSPKTSPSMVGLQQDIEGEQSATGVQAHESDPAVQDQHDTAPRTSQVIDDVRNADPTAELPQPRDKATSLEQLGEDPLEDEGEHATIPGVYTSSLGLPERDHLPVPHLHARPDALTEENLASQQAQHVAKTVRGTDLPTDDDRQDGDLQDEYVCFLQDAIGGRAEQHDVDAQPAEQAADSKPAPIYSINAQDGLDDAESARFPAPSQQEIDDIFENNINWPASPELPTRKELPQQKPVQANRMQSLEHNEGHGESSPVQPNEYPQDSELDLSVPEPEGGFQFTSSPPTIKHLSQMAAISDDQYRRSVSLPIEGGANGIGGAKPQSASGPQNVINLSSAASSSPSSSTKGDALPHGHLGWRRALETQDILNAETQQPDFHVPLPPDWDEDSEDLPSNPLRSSPPGHHPPAIGSQSIPEEEQLNAYIDTMIVHGYKEASILNALKCTSMRPELAHYVLLVERMGQGFPNDTQGVWSEEEDRILEGGNAFKLKQLEDKQSWEECEARMLYLQRWRDDE